LLPFFFEAVGDAEIQAKQLEALDELVAKHPETWFSKGGDTVSLEDKYDKW